MSFFVIFQCVFEVDDEGLIMTEMWPTCSIPEIQVSTGCQFRIANDLQEMQQIDD